MRRIGIFAFALPFMLCAIVAQADTLPSWNDTAPRRAIVAFVERITDAGGADFVPAAQRVAVFDMDGTLIPEKPVPAALSPIVRSPVRADAGVYTAPLGVQYCLVWEAGSAGALVDYRLRLRPAAR